MNCGELLEGSLRVSGIDAIYGPALPGLRTIEMQDVAVANLFAVAHECVHRRSAMVHMGGGVLARPDAAETGDTFLLESVADVVALPTILHRASGLKQIVLVLDPMTVVPEILPLAAPQAPRWLPHVDQVIDRLEASIQPVILAGPGVVRAGAQNSLSVLAASASAGVLNTWGAKGVFDWRSRHHLATVGLQEYDFELGGLRDADLIAAVGIDADEAPDELWRIRPVINLDPNELGPLAEALDMPYRSIDVPELRRRLAAITQEGWNNNGCPLPPTRVTLHYSQCLGENGFIAADAGLAGYWVARTFSTTQLGTASVSARSHPGLAAASVAVARLARPLLPAVAIVDGPICEETASVLEVASKLGVGVGVEAWDPDGPALDAREHVDRLRELTLTKDQRVESLRANPNQLAQMLEAAGRIIAWPGMTLG